ncbi:hypothetical protein EDD16DRAFT_1526858 [Pisolithus croceorrhizus]|nr:hypothetical protein EDD16DRAFT_1526858 [Pisolithus croceorrhizus]
MSSYQKCLAVLKLPLWMRTVIVKWVTTILQLLLAFLDTVLKEVSVHISDVKAPVPTSGGEPLDVAVPAQPWSAPSGTAWPVKSPHDEKESSQESEEEEGSLCTLDRVSDPVPHLAENSLVQFFGIFGDTSVCGDPLIFVESLIIDVAMDSGSLQLLFGGIHGHSAFAGRTVPSPISSITTVGDRVSGGFFIDHESDDEGQAIFPDEEDTFFLP